MTWRMAKSLEVLLAQINALSPNRDKSSDGGIGNEEHSARTSDHNPNDAGVVCARDFTNDPAHGIVSEELAEALRASRDRRIKYIISNGKIAASYPAGGAPAWAWRPYNGTNAHAHHCHLSVLADTADDTAPWALDIKPAPEHVAAPAAPAPVASDKVLRQGDKEPRGMVDGPIHQFQSALNAHGAQPALTVDGDYGGKTAAAAMEFAWNALKGK